MAQTPDRSAALYSTQIQFDANNEPIVSVGIMDAQREIHVSVQGALRILPDGPGGTEIVTAPATRWTAKLEGGTPGRTGHFVALGRFSANDLSVIQAARRNWKERGLKTRTTELGSTFGFFGKVMDTRTIAILDDTRHATREAAQKAATRLKAAHHIDADVLEVIVQRPRGTIVLTDGVTVIRGADVLWFEPARADKTTKVHAVEFGRGFEWHKREDRTFRGLLYVAVDPGGRLAIANMVPAETMLRGIVPAEIYASAPQPALQAQAVAARAELLAKIGKRHLADPYLTCSDVHCQVYAGTRREDDRTDKAIAATRGRMLFHEGKLVDTVYSANCGGHTEHNHHAWGHMSPHPTLRGRPDGPTPAPQTEADVHAMVHSKPAGFCNNRYATKSFRWEKRVSVDTIRRGMKAQGKDVGVPRNMEILKRGVSGRAISVRVHGTHGRKITIDGELNIRKAFGGLRSSLFVFGTLTGRDGHPTNFTFTGAGFGHGVGMCQTGAIGRAEAGHKATEILGHYYPGAEIERIY
ncbi:MAG: stage II sporulation protein D [Myxococcota bacterium]|jgi:stage II sporulation protein D